MNSATVKVYGAIADKIERDPYGPDGSGRAVVVNGRGFARWQRFNRQQDVVWLSLEDGRMVGLTPWQAKVFDLARTLVDQRATMREMATTLGCSPSTVSRALVKLMSWGLIGYMTGRGRYAATLLFTMHHGDGFDRFRQLAKAKVRAWALATERRLSRLQSNVAPYLHGRKDSRDSLTEYLYVLPSTKVATLKAWTPDELREAGIL